MQTQRSHLTGCRSQVRWPRAGVTLADLLLAVVLFALLLGLCAALSRKTHDSGNRIKCAANLRNIAAHAFIYANQDIRSGGKFPRTYYSPAAALDRSLTGNVAGTRSFDLANPAVVGVNNTQAAFYLLMKVTDLTPEVFVCPDAEATPAYAGADLAAYANWPAPYAAHNSYSYNCPFPASAGLLGRWLTDGALPPDIPLAADLNPGDTPAGGPTTVRYTDGRKVMRLGNSPNHWREGQQVAYQDQHVEWQTSPFAGVQLPGLNYRDNIYASAAGEVDASGKGGTVWAPPLDSVDAELLPTAQDSPGSDIAARSPDMTPPREADFLRSVARLLPAWMTAAVAAADVVGLCLAVRLVMRRRRYSAGPRHG